MTTKEEQSSNPGEAKCDYRKSENHAVSHGYRGYRNHFPLEQGVRGTMLNTFLHIALKAKKKTELCLHKKAQGS
jgi:hypothetical protein